VISPITVQAESQKGETEMTVSSGTQVSLEYTLRLEDKAVVDTNVGSEPLTYVHGSDQIVPGLEKGLEGMKKGESKEVTVVPEDGYGVVNPEALIEVEKEKVPENAVKVGAQLEGRDANGRPVYARVVEVKDKMVVLDFNHPLAGRTLYFDVKILDIQKGSAK
jgi:FKBP-type peptidyl-prolyl cis-trans isomerase SlyD